MPDNFLQISEIRVAREMVVRKSTDVKQIDYNFRLGDRAGLFASHPSD